MNYDITHNEEGKRFTLHINSHNAILDYQLRDGDMVFTHTYVPKELEGRGIGSALAKYALDYAVEHKYKIVPICPFIKTYIERHSEYSNIKE